MTYPSQDQNEEMDARTELEKMSLKDAFDYMKFYEESASKIKDRVWTLTTWILTLNTGIIAFCFTFYKDAVQKPETGFLPIEIAACLVGIALSLFLQNLIVDQGSHIRNSWMHANRIKNYKRSLIELLQIDEPRIELKMLFSKFFDKLVVDQYKSKETQENVPFPLFCRRLIALSWLFIFAFIGIMVLMIWLRRTVVVPAS